VHFRQFHDRLVVRVKEEVSAAKMVREKVDAVHASLELEEEGGIVSLVRMELARGERNYPHGLAAFLLHQARAEAPKWVRRRAERGVDEQVEGAGTRRI
jgi:Ni,Fe-hydrogenase III large subunit